MNSFAMATEPAGTAVRGVDRRGNCNDGRQPDEVRPAGGEAEERGRVDGRRMRVDDLLDRLRPVAVGHVVEIVAVVDNRYLDERALRCGSRRHRARATPRSASGRLDGT